MAKKSDNKASKKPECASYSAEKAYRAYKAAKLVSKAADLARDNYRASPNADASELAKLEAKANEAKAIRLGLKRRVEASLNAYICS